jgi:hypothetical protein
MGCLILKWDGAAIDRTLTGKYDYAFIFNTVAVVHAPPPTEPVDDSSRNRIFSFSSFNPSCDWTRFSMRLVVDHVETIRTKTSARRFAESGSP